jgi:hypothetical protein
MSRKSTRHGSRRARSWLRLEVTQLALEVDRAQAQLERRRLLNCVTPNDMPDC